MKFIIITLYDHSLKVKVLGLWSKPRSNVDCADDDDDDKDDSDGSDADTGYDEEAEEEFMHALRTFKLRNSPLRRVEKATFKSWWLQ